MKTEGVLEGRGMLLLDNWDHHYGGIARCCAQHCGWEGVPTYVRGKPSTHCPQCESRTDDEPDLREHALRHDIYVRQNGVYIERDGDLVRWAPASKVRALKQGRNDPCACGSGKKFKKCHGA